MIETVIPFIVECEKLKSVLRRTKPVDTDRRENSAEHSWSLALMAISLFTAVDPSLDQLRVLKMLLIHDIVEIDAGDTYCYDTRPDKEACERLAAERIFGLPQGGLSQEFMDLWKEFEANESRESTFANALDRLLPLIQNFHNGGRSWVENGITYEQAYSRNQVIRKGSEELWEYAKKLLAEAVLKGFLPEKIITDKDAHLPTIRRLRIGEGELYRRLRLESLNESPEAFASTYESASARSQESWSMQADASATCRHRATFVVLADQPIGLAALYRDETRPDEGELIQVWLSPESRGGTLATELMDAVFHWAASNGFETIRAEVTPANDRALRFYEKYGFVRQEVENTTVGHNWIFIKKVILSDIPISS
jgi:putative hydrolase of HD superfamily